MVIFFFLIRKMASLKSGQVTLDTVARLRALTQATLDELATRVKMGEQFEIDVGHCRTFTNIQCTDASRKSLRVVFCFNTP